MVVIMQRQKQLLFVAGEASGDAHAAAVIGALGGSVHTFGAGGPKMRAAGMELLFDLTEHAVVGLVEVIKKYRMFRGIFRRLVAEAEIRRPDAVVLVDFPGFNLRFATEMKRRGLRVIYYISPQVWAWHAGRARRIQRDVDLMLSIFPFEKQWYARHAPMLQVEFVGHPLADQITPPERNGTRRTRAVLFLPGSRQREVDRIWPVMRAVADRLPRDVQLVAVAVNKALANKIRHPRVHVEVGTARDWMRRVALAITASGTATMECAFSACPMIVLYKVNWLTYLVGRAVITVNWLAMPNVLAGRQVVPEFIQHDATPERIAAAAVELLENEEKRCEVAKQLLGVAATLGGPGASERAAKAILNAIGRPQEGGGQ
ncbi:MAG: lipid-A-disaccharide synthase [Verrucomicrobiae bacterium]|nr:lipid-A-disaccharide synthase [Verrucomicrobiae bacterium]